MNSSTGRTAAQKLTQDELKRQIAALQARLEPERESGQPALVLRSPKRKGSVPVTLAPATPSPRKKRRIDNKQQHQPIPGPLFRTAAQQNLSRQSGSTNTSHSKVHYKPPPSQLISKLATFKDAQDDAVEPIARSSSFSEKPSGVRPRASDDCAAPKRDDRLVLVEELEPGPYEHTAPYDDPEFQKLEPHSRINLSTRNVPHEDFADYLRGRYYLSPSQLYSSIRLLPDKTGYDVPVPGDWITIAVVAERGPIKFTRAPVALEREGDDDGPKGHSKRKADVKSEKPSGKKFVNMKLIDFGARARSASSATGGTSVIRGDAFLTLLLFESDTFELAMRDDGGKPLKIYKGGSRGAFENMTNVQPGDVIALLNPKVLKPYQRSNDTPHPVDNVLALTPESASSIIALGRARDLGMCTVRKQDGKTCGSWCDKRVSDVCDYHVQHAVQRRRAARPEFSISTMGLSSSSKHKQKHAYDPLRQWGLKPEESVTGGGGSNSTYIISGHVVSGTSNDPRTLYLSESMGREGQAKANRKLGGKDADKALKNLLERDKDGMKAVMKAREVGREYDDLRNAQNEEETRKGKKSKHDMTDRKGKQKQVSDSMDNWETKHNQDAKVGRNTYSAGVIRSLGFDPSLKVGQLKTENAKTQDKLKELEIVRTARRDIALGPRPGPKIRSGVKAPERKLPSQSQPPRTEAQEVPVHSDDDEQLPETVIGLECVPGGDEQMIDLDDF